MAPEAMIGMSVGILVVGITSGATYGIIQWFRRAKRSRNFAYAQ